MTGGNGGVPGGYISPPTPPIHHHHHHHHHYHLHISSSSFLLLILFLLPLLCLLPRPVRLLPLHKTGSSFPCNCGRPSLDKFAYRHTFHFSGEALQEINVQASLTLFPSRSVARGGEIEEVGEEYEEHEKRRELRR
ncbi:hypothetical protein E2C01_079566 [Portunus trituberculatus]|uniref:Uncharacterized protein n=1 Tax=Portunus trituberculatus TaxID=210409 RepID=A0A5B7IT40_PORTR|nr:hypothetical protein [Portunus trituberculatus]